MKEKQTGIMEKQILTAENLPEENQIPSGDKNQNKLVLLVKKLEAKIRNFKLFTKPKILIIASFVLLIIIVFFALFSISSKPKNVEPEIETKLEFTPTEPVDDKEISELKKEVGDFNIELRALETDFNDLLIPEVDLDIEF